MSATAPPKLPRDAALRVAQTVGVGSVLDGKYKVESVLGRGGMAIVVGARHETLGHRVAIKLLLPEIGASPAHAERVLREAKAAAGLTSENAVRVVDIGELDSGEPYIVMERLEGQDFAQLLKERRKLSVGEAASYLIQACEAIGEAHAKGIVHRDLKPSNLFLTKRPDGSALVKLMDFGISKVVSEEGEASLTRTQDSLGTPHYMSPEQLLTARDVDARTDVWALGVILYRLLTGEHPFNGETTPALHVAIASAPAPKLRAKREDAPAELEALVLRCLVKDRNKRLGSVAEFAAALSPFADEDTRRRYAHVGAVAIEPSVASLDPSHADAASSVPAEGVTRATWSHDRGGRSGRTRRGLIFVALGAVAAISIASAVAFKSKFAGSATSADATAAPPPTSSEAAHPADPPRPSAAATTTASAAASAGNVAVAPAPSSVPETAAHRRWKPAAPAATAASKADPYGQRR
jgi:eukaryotic-like serine/threonine-protein kinase